MKIMIRSPPTVQQYQAPACHYPLTTRRLGSIGDDDGDDGDDDDGDGDGDYDVNDHHDYHGLFPPSDLSPGCPAIFPSPRLFFSTGLEVSALGFQNFYIFIKLDFLVFISGVFQIGKAHFYKKKVCRSLPEELATLTKTGLHQNGKSPEPLFLGEDISFNI